MYNQFTLSHWHLSPPFLCVQNVCLSFVFRFPQLFFFIIWLRDLNKRFCINLINLCMSIKNLYCFEKSLVREMAKDYSNSRFIYKRTYF